MVLTKIFDDKNDKGGGGPIKAKFLLSYIYFIQPLIQNLNQEQL